MSEGHCEARVDHRRENAKGVFITFLVHPDEVSKLDGLRAGSTVVLGWAETINANVEKIEIQGDCSTAETNGPVAQLDEQQNCNLPVAGSSPAGASKVKRAFKDMPLSQQAGIRCGEVEFVKFLASGTLAVANDWQKLSPVEWVRRYCGVESRTGMDIPYSEAGRLWKELESNYQAWRTTQMYADTRR